MGDWVGEAMRRRGGGVVQIEVVKQGRRDREWDVESGRGGIG